VPARFRRRRPLLCYRTRWRQLRCNSRLAQWLLFRRSDRGHWFPAACRRAQCRRRYCQHANRVSVRWGPHRIIGPTSDKRLRSGAAM